MTTSRIARLVLIAVLMGLGGCNAKPEASPDPKARFRGVTVKILIPEQIELQSWIDDQRGEWSAATGGQVEVQSYAGQDPTTPQSGIAGSALAETDLPDTDILIFPSTGMANAVASGLATKVPKELLDDVAFESRDIATAVTEQLISWDRQVYALPVSAETELIYFRSDLITDEANQAAFQNRFGQPLRPPGTWDEFDQIARFFDGTDLDGDAVPDSSLAIANAADASICRAAAYGKPPQNLSFYFDVNSMEPLCNGPAFQLSLEKWVEIASCMGDEPAADPALRAFASGRAALAVGSSRLARALLGAGAARSDNRVAGKVGCAPIPGAARVYFHDKQDWADLSHGALNRVAIVRGLCASVPRASKHADAAFDFLAFLTNRQRSLPTVTSASVNLGPFRSSQVVDSAAWLAGGWPATGTSSFLSAIEESLNQSNAITMLRIDGADAFHRSLDLHVARALRAEQSAADALATVAESWRAIRDERGKDRVRRQYRYSLGIPVLN